MTKRNNYEKTFIFVILLAVAVSCFSQPKDSLRLRHEVSFGIGTPSFMDLAVVIGSMGDYRPWWQFQGQYLYNVNRHIGVGGLLIPHIYKQKHGKGNEVLFTISPVVRCYWFNKENFGMYSKLGAGVVGTIIESDKKVIPMINLTPIAMEFGEGKCRGYVELLCIGSLGLFNGGVKLNL